MSNTQSPFVSVLMPAYNVEPYIQQAIQSILDQTYTNFELIVSDDGSQDGTVDVLSTFSDPRIVRLLHAKNVGYAENMNVLFKAAKGEYLIIQDADDYSSENRLQVLVDFLTTNKEIDLVGSSYVKVTEQEEVPVSVPIDMSIISKSFTEMLDPLPVLNGTVLFKREIIEKGFLFRNLKYIQRGQDEDWLFRVSEHFKMANVKEALYYYRVNSSSMTQDPSHNTYYSIFAGEFIRFIKEYRMIHGVDVLADHKVTLMNHFFEEKKKTLTAKEPAYIELYIAHKYIGQGKRSQAVKWLLYALLKDISNAYTWKKIVYVLWKKG